ncbi:hypothetical protein NMG60_11031263 [Bertholletia excelsa]
MDLGMVGLDSALAVPGSGSGACFAVSSSISRDPETQYGSGGLKQGRPGTVTEEYWRGSKAAKADDGFSASSKAMLMRSNGSVFSDGHQMLSFSSPNSLPYYNGRNTGYGAFTAVRGPFTPSQWMELEHQALIYKYLTANVPVPINLLLPIRKALDSAGLSGFAGGAFGPSTWSWGAFRLGFSNTTDPEPGRCRRTDGKKWRCSRDAVADQKYCERHMNRGRHRSRKPVEAQSVAASTAVAAAKLMPVGSSTPPVSSVVVPSGGPSNGLSLANHPQLENLQPSAASSHINRGFLGKKDAGDAGRVHDKPGLSMFSPAIGLNENQYSIPKQNAYEESSQTEFGRVCSDSLLNPLHRNYCSPRDLHDGENEPQQSVHQFMDEWPKKWSDLSIAIPVAPADYMSSTSSPAHEKLGLRLSSELDPIQMGLGLGGGASQPGQRQANWVPISWENSMGGPLGEVLHNTNGSSGDGKSSPGLNLLAEASSPTGVLQKVAFGSLSNSSAGSSPRAENHNDLLISSSLTNTSSLPAL